MPTHLLVVDLKHLEDCVLLPVFHRGYYSPELHYLSSSATTEVKQRRGVRGLPGFLDNSDAKGPQHTEI